MCSIQVDSPVILFPEIIAESIEPEAILLTLRIPERLAYFAGHFDGIAIVPGIVQVQWAIHYAQQYFMFTHRFSHMEVIKFKELLLPGQCLNLRLYYQEADCKLTFCYQSETTDYSSGRIYFHNDVI